MTAKRYIIRIPVRVSRRSFIAFFLTLFLFLGFLIMKSFRV